jgi:tetratricopeptide (TPR) repeat protein
MEPPEKDVWIDEGHAGGDRRSASRPTKAPSRRRRRSPSRIDTAELSELVGSKRATTLAPRIAAAADAFADERYPEARQILQPMAKEVPGSPIVRELLGLTLYRLGRWQPAAKELEAFRDLTGGSTEQNPVLADCYRAQRRYDRADELWAELRDASPSGELVTEGRIVAAGTLADRGRIGEAIELLERGWRLPKAPRDHHLRRAYALADLYERAGDLPRARETFGWVLRNDRSFADAAERAAGL